MASSSSSKKFPVEVHYGGVFVENPFEYACGEVKDLDDVDFTNMQLVDLEDFLTNETNTVFTSLYFCVPGKELKKGLKLIKCDADVQNFVNSGLKSMEKVSLFLDHYEEDLSEFLVDDEHKVAASGVQSKKVIASGVQPQIDSDDDDLSPYDDDDDDDDDETASLDHLSDGEDELREFRKKKVSYFTPKKHGKSDQTMEDEHGSFLNDLCASISRENYEGKIVKIEDNSDRSEDEDGERVHGDNNNGHHRQDDSNLPIHNPKTHWKLMKPILGERYESPVQLKECLTNYAVANGYKIWFERNDCNKLLAKCRKGDKDDEQDCPWRLWASWMSTERSFQVKSLVDEHKCVRNFKACPLVTYKWIGKNFGSKIRQNPSIKLNELQAEVMKKYKFQVTLTQCSRARTWAINEYEQGMKQHYEKLWSYTEEIKRTNPGSTVKLNVEVSPNGKVYFQSYYVCFQGLKEGWKSGCRRIIGLNGCSLKTICKGELISAVGRDGNNQMFPVAWAVVSIQSQENWLWFLKLLKDDLDLAKGADLTLISNQDKGLPEAVKEVLPYAEHRQCARHIYYDLKEKFNEIKLRNLFWAASKAAYPEEFEEVMNTIKDVNPEAYNYLKEKEPTTWSRAFFQTGRGCDTIENFMSECFNSLIVEARKKPIIILLEAIRIILMERIARMSSKVEKWTDDVCPAIRKKLDHVRDKQRIWRVIPCGGSLFEVKRGTNVFIVDEKHNTCSCRTWQLSGVPCPHAMAAISFINRTPESYIPDWFKKTMFTKAYSNYLKPMNGMKMWPTTTYTNPLPPKVINIPKKAKLKRKRDLIEVNVSSSGQVRRAGATMTCQKCNQVGHNKRTCKVDLISPPPNGQSSQSGKSQRGGRGRGRGSESGSQRGGRGSQSGSQRGGTGSQSGSQRGGRGGQRGRGRGQKGRSLDSEFSEVPVTAVAMVEPVEAVPLLTWTTEVPIQTDPADVKVSESQKVDESQPADVEVSESQKVNESQPADVDDPQQQKQADAEVSESQQVNESEPIDVDCAKQQKPADVEISESQQINGSQPIEVDDAQQQKQVDVEVSESEQVNGSQPIDVDDAQQQKKADAEVSESEQVNGSQPIDVDDVQQQKQAADVEVSESEQVNGSQPIDVDDAQQQKQAADVELSESQRADVDHTQQQKKADVEISESQPTDMDCAEQEKQADVESEPNQAEDMEADVETIKQEQDDIVV